MEQVTDLWLVLRQQFDTLAGRLHQVSFDHLLLIASVACLAALVLLISRLRASRAYRRMRDEKDSLKQQLAALQATYDSEIRWRTASETHSAAKATT